MWMHNKEFHRVGSEDETQEEELKVGSQTRKDKRPLFLRTEGAWMTLTPTPMESFNSEIIASITPIALSNSASLKVKGPFL